MKANRGFESMIPKDKVVTEPIFKNRIRFKLFNRVFSLTFEVRR